MRLAIISTVICAASLCAIPAQATLVDISATTNKPVYELGEEVVVFIIAYNPNPEPVTLHFGSTLVAKYIMDGIFDWSQNKGFLDVYLELTIEPYEFQTWKPKHSISEMKIYPLDIGIHTVVGEVVGYGQSAPVEFNVVPEPATFVLFGLGGIVLVRKVIK